MSRIKQDARVMDAVLADLAPFKPIAAPVDVNDAEEFPEIARATARLGGFVAGRAGAFGSGVEIMTEKNETALPAIKGMNPDMTCRGYKFEVGKTYTIEGKVKACESGFHACPADDETPPHAVFEYYAPGVSRYFDVTASGATDRDSNKIASASITIGVEITMGELMRRVAEWCFKKAKGAASNSGYGGAASNSGTCGAASNSGYGGAASNSGTCGAASNSGYGGAASNSGYGGAASNSGARGAASNSGDRGAASNSGDCGAASNSGYRGAAFSHAYASKVMCEGDGQALYCTEFADDGSIASVACGITGKKGIKAGIWYHAKAGKLVKVA